jgi:hypothetical protein
LWTELVIDGPAKANSTRSTYLAPRSRSTITLTRPLNDNHQVLIKSSTTSGCPADGHDIGKRPFTEATDATVKRATMVPTRASAGGKEGGQRRGGEGMRRVAYQSG